MSCPAHGGDAVFLTRPALELLELFRTRPFLPLGRSGGKPLFIDDDGARRVNSVLALSLNGLITTDFASPLSGFDYSPYSECEELGSMALTLRGQEALDSIDIQGIDE